MVNSNVIKRLSSLWRVDCDPKDFFKMVRHPAIPFNSKTPDVKVDRFRKKFMEYVQQTVYLGLLELEKVNSNLVISIADEDRQVPLRFTCLTHRGNPLPKNFYDAEEGILNVPDLAYYLSSTQTIYHKDLHSSTRPRSVLFHEILHYWQVNNTPNSEHNKPLSQRSPSHAMEDDVVYACTAQAFKDLSSLTPIARDRSKKLLYGLTQRACRTCALARKVGEKTQPAQDARSLSQASLACQDIQDEDYAFKPYSVRIDYALLGDLGGFE
jgi:hypothetical protein